MDTVAMGTFVGAFDHAGYALLVTVRDGALVDRREVALVDAALPKMPHHHEGQKLALDEAVALVEKVRASAEHHARVGLEALERSVGSIEGIALRALPTLPPTVAERITSYRAMCVADWVMYRSALGEAAVARGWRVSWYEPKRVLDDATRALGRDVAPLLAEVGRRIGPPWRKEHRVAMAAALAAP